MRLPCAWLLALVSSASARSASPSPPSPPSTSPSSWRRVELHIHLDGSQDAETLLVIAQRRNLSLPLAGGGGTRVPRSAAEIADLLAATTPAWHRFDVVNDIVGGDAAAVRFAAEAFADRQRASEVRYTEVRYDPVRLQSSAYAPGDALTGDAVVAAVAAGLRARTDVVVHQILCAMRGSTTAACADVAALAARSAGRAPGGVVGLDLAGDELRYDNAAYVSCFVDAGALGLRRTAHVGEGFGNLSSESSDMYSALATMGVDRVGHGYAAGQNGTLNATLVGLLRSRGVHLETCPNAALREEALQPGVFRSIAAFREAGLDIGLNTDDPATYFGNCSLASVEDIAREQLGFTDADITAAYDRACAAAFGECPPRS